MGMEVGGFVEEEACSWFKAKVSQWGGDARGILELARSLHCFPLVVAQAAEHARIYLAVTPAEYLNELKRVGLNFRQGQQED